MCVDNMDQVNTLQKRINKEVTGEYSVIFQLWFDKEQTVAWILNEKFYYNGENILESNPDSCKVKALRLFFVLMSLPLDKQNTVLLKS